jgi:UPF0271 protein
MKISSEDAECYTTYQIGALKAFLKMYDMKLHHVKPHGAFFVMATKDEDLAEAFVNSVKATAPEAMMLLPAPLTYPLALKGQKAGIRIIGQLYPDLTYNPDGSQIIERVKKSVDPPQVCEKVLRFLREKKVKAINDQDFDMEGEGIGIHGDTPNIIQVLRNLHEVARKENIKIETAI